MHVQEAVAAEAVSRKRKLDEMQKSAVPSEADTEEERQQREAKRKRELMAVDAVCTFMKPV